MGKIKKINWEKARSEYISNRSLSLKKLAAKYGISYSYFQNVSSKEGWVKDKTERWQRSEKKALEEVEGSLKDLIIRHAKVARFLQAGGIKRLQKRLRMLELADNNPKLAKEIREMDDRTLIAMVSEGLKAERELYPKQLEIKGEVDIIDKNASSELKKAVKEVYEKFRRDIRKPNTGRGKKNKAVGLGSRKCKNAKR